jgi:hypothetical protein
VVVVVKATARREGDGETKWGRCSRKRETAHECDVSEEPANTYIPSTRASASFA